jgi:hypothetical protein
MENLLQAILLLLLKHLYYLVHQKLKQMLVFLLLLIVSLLCLNQWDLKSNLFHHILLLQHFQVDDHQKLKLLFVFQLLLNCCLAVFKLAGEFAQDVPSYSSVAPVVVGVAPPKAKADVCIPAAATPYLAVFKLLLDVQLLPSYSSVAPVGAVN